MNSVERKFSAIRTLVSMIAVNYHKNMDLLFYTCVGQKSYTGLWAKIRKSARLSSFWRLRENLIPCPYRLREAHSLALCCASPFSHRQHLISSSASLFQL